MIRISRVTYLGHYLVNRHVNIRVRSLRPDCMKSADCFLKGKNALTQCPNDRLVDFTRAERSLLLRRFIQQIGGDCSDISPKVLHLVLAFVRDHR